MIDYVLEAAYSLKPRKIAVVVGNDRTSVLDHLKGRRGLVFAHQKQRLGTAHAVQTGLDALGVSRGEIIILSGDVPLLQSDTLKSLCRIKEWAPLAFLTAVLPDPTGYGRVVRDFQGKVIGIVEEKNAGSSERQINEINAGVYRVEAGFLRRALPKIKRDPVKKEYYLTELVTQALAQGRYPQAHSVADAHEVLGANTRAELAYLNQNVRSALAAFHLANGVGMEDPGSVFLDYGVKIGSDSFLGAGVHLKGDTRLGSGVLVEAGCILKNCRIGNGVTLKAYSYLEDCEVLSDAVIGPFARVRPGSIIEGAARVGNFVELKKTRLGRGSKVNHLSYLGDAVVGKDVNVGAGTITCNYDGKRKYATVIADGVFIGSDSQLVAPVKIGKRAYVGAGTTVTKDVPAGALVTSRVPQKNARRRNK
jgi:bifunctional UDP-N-acetylglucosamine pyrophosphorylase/glucosamine-1-phosphate N-acetyltransferase